MADGATSAPHRLRAGLAVTATLAAHQLRPDELVDAILARWDIDAVFDDPEAARADGLRAVSAAATSDDDGRLGWAHLLAGGALAALAETAEAERHLDEAEALFRSCGERAGLGHTLLRRTLVTSPAKRFERNVRDLEEALEIARAEGDEGLEATVLSDLGAVLADVGDCSEAMVRFHEAIEIAQRHGDLIATAGLYNNLGSTLLDLGDTAGARPWLDDARTVAAATGSRSLAYFPLVNLARCHEQAGDLATALALSDEARRIAASTPSPRQEACALLDVGRLRALLGDADRARADYSAAAAILARLDGAGSAEATRAAWYAASADAVPGDEMVDRLTAALAALSGEETLSLQVELAGALADAHERRGEHRQATLRLRQVLDAERAARRREIAAHAQRLAAQTNIERTRRELADARTRGEELRRANAELAEANRRAESLLQELERQAVLLERQSIEDALTGLHNRRHLDAELARETTRSARFGHPLSVAMVDIDRFKDVNDRFSHQTGDDVLRRVADLLRAGVRATDTVARYGGEEFVLVLPETDLDGATRLVEELRVATEAVDWAAVRPGLVVTISAGVATGYADHAADRLLASADALLYLAKRRGRNQVRSSAVAETGGHGEAPAARRGRPPVADKRQPPRPSRQAMRSRSGARS